MNKEEYKAYQDRVTENINRMDMPYTMCISPGACPGCEDCTDIQYDIASEPYFSWLPCDICYRPLGGDRYPAHYIDNENEIVHLNICSDCYYYIEYGRLDDLTMMEIEE